ncbi:TonB-dependent receptor [Aquimarina sp. RZ0]|uniref:SusC/RagA family TonB-linked outer membrane protein n=1 Tax=Aquimarina sp. RZ0 TaxID=2607730 RepID=UPI0011F15D5E|nr:TonB-dependent receptor [Aquimarina sp. RZ0]KAA1247479.1 TonB-dependent receptor [Aquimarina sp. RZ0]
MKKRIPKRIESLFKLICLLFFCKTTYVQAQSISVKGKITDDKGTPLLGASVVIKNKNTGTTADFDGNYSINTVDSNDVLLFSYVGYANKEVNVNGQSIIDVNLEPDLQALDEVIVVGYGAERRSQLTGAVATVNTEALNRNTSASLDNTLQGLAAGISVTNNNATPGGGVSVRIRGAGGVNNSEPLYVVDGFPISVGSNENSSPLSLINPQDIESISVLKDAASAAIYGTRAANGVILITTKRGRFGQKGIVSVNVKTGLQAVAKKLDLMDAQTFVEFTNTSSQNAGFAIPPGFDNPASFGKGTDWIETITRVAPVTDLQASFSGGGENGNYFLSLGQFEQEGIVIGTSFKRITARLNADQKVSKKLTTGASVAVTRSKQNSLGRVRLNNTALSFATLFYPTIPVFDENGNYAPTPANGFYKPQVNPLFRAEGPRFPPIQHNLLGNVSLKYDIISGLQFKTTGYYTFENTVSENFGRIFDLGAAGSTEQSILKRQFTGTTVLLENIVSYNFNKNNHSVGLLLGQSVQDRKSESLQVTGDYPREGNVVINEQADNLRVNNRIDENSLLSYFGKLNYSFRDKYLMTAIIRRDGSSRFGSENKWGTFPSISLGWRISEEDFISTDGMLSSLKIRGGWGQVGYDDGIGNYAFSATVNQDFNYPFGNQEGVITTGSAVTGIPNPNIQWEVVTQYSIGIDADFLDNRLNVVAEYYDKTQDKMLIRVPISAVTGVSSGSNQGSLSQNIGALTNKGFEFSINYTGKIGELTYSVGANVTTINNKITDVPAPINAFNFGGNNLTRTENNRSLGEFFGFVADGIFQNQAEVDAHATQNEGTAPGDIRFVDISGPDGVPDGVINNDDRTFIGSPIPEFTYGFNINLNYRNFDFSLQGNGVSGNKIFNLTKLNLIDNNRSENKLNFIPWSPENPNSQFPRAIANDPNNNIRNSSYFVEDGSFTRIKIIELGYSIPQNTIKKIGMSQMRVFGGVQNPFTFTDYSGVDPEVGNARGSNLAAGIDYFVYPIARVFSMGVNMKF